MSKARSTMQQSGFSLLEMVLVLLIMGMIASLSTVFIDNEDNQLRYEESMHKLTILQDAVLAERRYQDQVLLSGFIIDNGVLPSDIANLITASPTDWAVFSAQTPEYRIADDDLSYTPLSGITLNKGYRAGYIRSGLDSQNTFKDGWGDDFDLTALVNGLSVQYLGTGKPEDFDNDVNKPINEDDWSVALSAINISIKNRTGSDIPSTTPIYIVIIVFKNIQTNTTDADKSNDSVWQTYHFKLTGLVANTDTHNHAHNSINNDAPWKDEAGEDATATRIPAGEHIAFVAVDSNDDNKIVPAEIQEDKALLKVIPRFTQPNMTLVIPKDLK